MKKIVNLEGFSIDKLPYSHGMLISFSQMLITAGQVAMNAQGEINSDNLQKVREIYLKKLLKPKLSSEWAGVVAESYKETIGEPMIIRRVKALKKF